MSATLSVKREKGDFPPKCPAIIPLLSEYFLVFKCYDVHSVLTMLQTAHIPRMVVFIATAAAMYILGHGLCTLTAVPGSTQTSTLCGTVK